MKTNVIEFTAPEEGRLMYGSEGQMTSMSDMRWSSVLRGAGEFHVFNSNGETYVFINSGQDK